MIYLGQDAIGLNQLHEFVDIFKIVYRFTPEETTGRYTIPNFGNGLYIFCEDPILTPERAITLSYPNNALQLGEFVIYNNTFASKGVTSTIKTDGTYDAWGTYAVPTASTIEIGGSASNSQIAKFTQNHNYIVLKINEI